VAVAVAVGMEVEVGVGVKPATAGAAGITRLAARRARPTDAGRIKRHFLISLVTMIVYHTLALWERPLSAAGALQFGGELSSRPLSRPSRQA